MFEAKAINIWPQGVSRPRPGCSRPKPLTFGLKGVSRPRPGCSRPRPLTFGLKVYEAKAWMFEAKAINIWPQGVRGQGLDVRGQGH